MRGGWGLEKKEMMSWHIRIWECFSYNYKGTKGTVFIWFFFSIFLQSYTPFLKGSSGVLLFSITLWDHNLTLLWGEQAHPPSLSSSPQRSLPASVVSTSHCVCEPSRSLWVTVVLL